MVVVRRFWVFIRCWLGWWMFMFVFDLLGIC